MADRRAVDELTIEELEQILLIKRRQARQESLRRLAGQGRLAGQSPLLAEGPKPLPSAAGGRFHSPNVQPWSGGSSAPSKGGRLRDRLLLGLEITALVGLIAVFDCRRFGWSRVVSTGNEAVIVAADVLEYLIDDPATATDCSGGR